MTPLPEFLSSTHPLFDLRSPSEFCQGHIPGARSLPLFDDAERSHVGTVYKQISPAQAFDLGIRYVSPKLPLLIDTLRNCSDKLRLMCWRGGMRSQILSRLLTAGGFQIQTLEGGYKAFRRWVLTSLSKTELSHFKLIVLGGLTGCGKTHLLRELCQRGEQVLDLEALANHRGSHFGHLGQLEQPTTEHFENQIATTLRKFNPSLPVWLEDEGWNLGKCTLPQMLIEAKEESPWIEIRSTLEDRISKLIQDYGNASSEALSACILRLEKRLGSERTRQACRAIASNDLRGAVEITLDYYDRTYTKALSKKSIPPTHVLHWNDCDREQLLTLIIELGKMQTVKETHYQHSDE